MIPEGGADDIPDGDQVRAIGDATYTVVFSTSARVAPAAASASVRLASTCRAWSRRSPRPTTDPCSSSGHAPAVNTTVPGLPTVAYA